MYTMCIGDVEAREWRCSIAPNQKAVVESRSAHARSILYLFLSKIDLRGPYTGLQAILYIPCKINSSN